MTPARQPQECKTCIHDGKFETQCCVMSGHYYNVCAISKIQVIEGKPIIRCSTHTSAPAPEHMVSAYAHGKVDGAKAAREQAQQGIGAVIYMLEMQIGCSEMLYAEGHEYYGDAYEQLRDECTKAIAALRAQQPEPQQESKQPKEGRR